MMHECEDGEHRKTPVCGKEESPATSISHASVCFRFLLETMFLAVIKVLFAIFVLCMYLRTSTCIPRGLCEQIHIVRPASFRGVFRGGGGDWGMSLGAEGALSPARRPRLRNYFWATAPSIGRSIEDAVDR